MSAVGNAFKTALGRPAPAARNGLHFTKDYAEDLWTVLRKEVGCGWYRDQFLYLFGEGLGALLPCLDAWSFLVPPNRDRIIVGRNAHGALLVIDDANSAADSVHVLDPFRIAWWGDTDCIFGNLLGYWLAENSLPHFQDDKVYKRWVKENHRTPGAGMILAPKVPVGLGGKFELANFQEENLLDFYATSGPIYRKAFETMGVTPAGGNQR